MLALLRSDAQSALPVLLAHPPLLRTQHNVLLLVLRSDDSIIVRLLWRQHTIWLLCQKRRSLQLRWLLKWRLLHPCWRHLLGHLLLPRRRLQSRRRSTLLRNLMRLAPSRLGMRLVRVPKRLQAWHAAQPNWPPNLLCGSSPPSIAGGVGARWTSQLLLLLLLLPLLLLPLLLLLQLLLLLNQSSGCPRVKLRRAFCLCCS